MSDAQEGAESTNGYNPSNISAMSNETLDDAIAKLQGQNSDTPEEGEEETGSEGSAAEEGEQQSENEQDDKGKAASEEDNQPLPRTRAELDKLIAETVAKETATLQKRVKDSQSRIHTRDAEVGQLRKQLTEARTKLETALKEGDFAHAGEAAQAASDLKDVDKALHEIDSEEEERSYTQKNYDYVSQHVDLNQVPTEDVIRTLKAVGASDEYIETFLQNPFKQASGDGLVWFFRNVQAEKALREILPMTKQLYEMLQSQEKNSDEKGKRVLEKIADVSKHAQRMGGGSGNSKSAGKSFAFNQREAARLSDSDLEAAIAREEKRV